MSTTTLSREEILEQARRILYPPTSESVLLEACRSFIRRYVIASNEQAIVLAAWILHTWAIEAFDSTPYLHITAPEKQCGKSVLLRTIQALVRQPLKSGGMSAAALVRTIHMKRPTLLLDEIDALTKGDKELGEAFRGVLNNGFERGTPYVRLEGKAFDVKEFDVFCPKALAGIGKVWDTVADRSIVIELQRKSPHEKVESSRERFIRQTAAPIREELEAWASASVIEGLRVARPAMPSSWADRQQDISEPLVAIADTAGGVWPENLRSALSGLFGSGAAEDESISVTLLRDIRTAFEGSEKIASADLAEKLREMEGQPWADWAHGKGLDANRLARLLKKFSISPRQTRMPDGSNKRAYEPSHFKDVWERYTPSRPVVSPHLSATGATTSMNTGDSPHSRSATHLLQGATAATSATEKPEQVEPSPVACSRSDVLPATHLLQKNPHKSRVVAGVTEKVPDMSKPELLSEVSL